MQGVNISGESTKLTRDYFGAIPCGIGVWFYI
ncbi:hypothetical protein Huta_0149 [Halorhabdus utahensis DSM 12940]|uniref:Uncharacterized protein n=1 Tax=Halorhabdus utahensis (strain DSM 12940 / JCM 11049 / AX-2) TaxID=519442 RepID=C7NP46_HALUD|nr:hypothetical protein Huta_0149 [Halorhabdus utahensis DSM 12940]